MFYYGLMFWFFGGEQKMCKGLAKVAKETEVK